MQKTTFATRVGTRSVETWPRTGKKKGGWYVAIQLTLVDPRFSVFKSLVKEAS